MSVRRPVGDIARNALLRSLQGSHPQECGAQTHLGANSDSSVLARGSFVRMGCRKHHTEFPQSHNEWLGVGSQNRPRACRTCRGSFCQTSGESTFLASGSDRFRRNSVDIVHNGPLNSAPSGLAQEFQLIMFLTDLSPRHLICGRRVLVFDPGCAGSNPHISVHSVLPYQQGIPGFPCFYGSFFPA